MNHVAKDTHSDFQDGTKIYVKLVSHPTGLIVIIVLVFLFLYIFLVFSNFILLIGSVKILDDIIGFKSNTQIIAEELRELNETEIKDYPLTDLPIETIKAVFTILDPGNLSKVLLNIPVQDIKEIQNKMSKKDFDSKLNSLSKENQDKFEDRIENN